MRHGHVIQARKLAELRKLARHLPLPLQPRDKRHTPFSQRALRTRPTNRLAALTAPSPVILPHVEFDHRLTMWAALYVVLILL